MKTVVMKFGGTSMGSASAIEKVIDVIRRRRKERRVRAVVVSAMSGVTDMLIECAHRARKKDRSYRKLLQELESSHRAAAEALIPERSREATMAQMGGLFRHLESVLLGIYRLREQTNAGLAYVSSFGERLSAHLLTDALNARGTACDYLNARQLIATDDHYLAATVNFAATDVSVRSYFARHKKLQVVTGFIGATEEGKTTTLGRGGSDYSAAIIGAALRADSIEIWTDVSGIMTADPRQVPTAKVVPELAFEEAGELAYFGAKVLHPKTILPAMRKGIPVRVLNTFAPLDRGTTIVANFAKRRMKSRTVEALTCKRPVLAIHIQSPEFFDVNGFMTRIFEIFDRHRTSIDVVTTSVASVSVTVEDDVNVAPIVKELQALGPIKVEHGKAIICAVGGSINAAGVVGRMFSVLGARKIAVEMISQEASNVSITFVVAAKDAEKVLKILHKEYIE